ncbi:hypothetical protein O181_035408 [Austropuccinia psidii MF-1]|uniref:VHS domain-containing protein n=1 Tax=Austropuccinia psidii MF-1 TaxID=1389203 RepID=A0A9Q3D5E7_9BASI|nr:hypothetical protein [Austropuccinia psidii MF-1]
MKAKVILSSSSKHSSTAITSWIQRASDPHQNLAETDFNNLIIELIQTINLQSKAGIEEASRAIRKKLKHGSAPEQKKSLSVLESLALNSSSRFTSSLIDNRLAETFKLLAFDPTTDRAVKRKLMNVLYDWQRRYSNDSSTATLSDLYKTCGGKSTSDQPLNLSPISNPTDKTIRNVFTGIDNPSTNPTDQTITKKSIKKEKEEKQNKKKAAKKSKQLELTAVELDNYMTNFLKSQIIDSLANGSQLSSNLVNTLQLTNPQTIDIQTDTYIQSLVNRLKLVQKDLIRYIRTLTEKDSENEYLGTLLNTNSQVITALELYHSFTDPIQGEMNSKSLKKQVETNLLELQPSEESNPFETNEESQVLGSKIEGINHDLLELDLTSPITSDSINLPSPIKPNHIGKLDGTMDYDPGTLSDYSEFESLNEESSLDSKSQPCNNNSHEKNLMERKSKDASQNSVLDNVSNHNHLDPFADPS